MPDREEYVVTDDGARLWTATVGTGRPFVWCHGGPGDADNLSPLVAMLADVARVRRYEQRACGRSSGVPPFTMARSVADLEALRRHWGHERWLVGGVSFGAALALAYAAEHPERVEGVAFVSCLVRLAGQPDWFEEYRRAHLARMPQPARVRYLELRRLRRENGDADPALAAEARQIALAAEFADARTARRFAGQLEAELAAMNHEVNRELGEDFVRYFAAPELRPKLRALACPVLLVHGAEDPRPLAALEALAAELSNGRLVPLSSVGHFPIWEAPPALREVLREFAIA
jgi:proline iminopeptidase